MRILKYNIISMLKAQLPAFQIASRLGISKSTLSEHIKNMKKEGLIEVESNSKPKFYRLTAKGEENRKSFSISSTKTNLLKKNRLHALEIHCPLFRTEYSKLEQKLAEKHIFYEKNGNMAMPMLIVHLSSNITIKLTTKNLIGYGAELEKPIYVNSQEIVDEGLSKTLLEINDFIGKIGINCQRGLDGKLIAKIRYFEIAITNSELANKISNKEKRSWITLAYDRATNKPSIWLDHSDSWELEGNKLKSYEPIRKWAQGIEDQVINPYEDEIRTREYINEIAKNLNEASNLVKYYAENMESHAKLVKQASSLIKELRKERRINKIIINQKNQKKLLEYK